MLTISLNEDFGIHRSVNCSDFTAKLISASLLVLIFSTNSGSATKTELNPIKSQYFNASKHLSGELIPPDEIIGNLFW
ncbi:Uncharacterised protein, partial [Mycoplasma putrefaciens]